MAAAAPSPRRRTVGSAGRLIGEPLRDPRSQPVAEVVSVSYVGEAGTPPKDNQGYGDAYIQGYRDLWGLGG